jgi:nucleoside-diphosphate-sugar epimerase
MDMEFQELISQRNVHFIKGDLTDPGLFMNLDKDYHYLYHLAAVIGVKNVVRNPDKVLHTNALSTLNVYEYAKHMKSLKKLFYSSTSEVYAGTLKLYGINIPTDESVPLVIEDITAYRTTYALSKIYGESIGFVYGRKYNIPFTSGRYHNVYGPRMGYAHVIPEMFIKIDKNNVIDVPSSTHTRAFCFIEDAVEFTIRACENPNTNNEILHIGNSSEEISIRDLVVKIAGILGKSVTLNELDDTAGSPARRCPDITKIQSLTGYTPRVTLNEGIQRTYEWYKDKLGARYE